MSASINIQCLPDNVLLEILSYLRAVEVARIGRVCKRFYDISNDKSLWKTLHLAERCFSPQYLLKVTKRYAHKNTEAIYLNGNVTPGHPLQWMEMSDDYFKFICKTCPKLKIFSIERGMDLTGIQAIKLPKTLHTLQITHCITPHVIQCMRWWPTLGSPKLYPNLKHLDLSLCPLLTDLQVSCLLGHTGLVELILTGCPEITDISFKNIATKLVNLELLHIYGTGNCSTGSLRLFAKHLTKLRILNLGENHGSNAGLRALHPMKSLEELIITRTKRLNNAGIKQLKAMEGLDKLSIRNILTEKCLAELGEELHCAIYYFTVESVLRGSFTLWVG